MRRRTSPIDATAVFWFVVVTLIAALLLANVIRCNQTQTVYTPAVVLDTAQIRIEVSP